MKRICVLCFLLIFTVVSIFAQEKKFQWSLFGGGNYVLKYGAEDDYVLGENDFPVTPAHTTPAAGTALAFFFTRSMGVRLEGIYFLDSEVTLKDPSDEDTVKIKTSKHFSLSANFILRFLSGRFRPFLFLGGGLDYIQAKDEIYTSEYGFEIKFFAPEEKIDPVVQAGAGLQVFFSSLFGLNLDVRTIFILDDPDNVGSICANFGIFLGF